ncbi:BTB/POZ protein [Xylaria sp. FL1042]|nr:BTB/POZ protein [Xylaria sp. FL1042]
MWDTRSKRKKVYLEWKWTFCTFENSRLRKQKAIRAVVQQYDPRALRYDPDIVKTLQSLLKDNIFRSSWAAEAAFPELFIARDNPSTTAPPPQSAGPVVPAVFGMDEPSKELLTSFKQLYANGEYSDLIITCYGKQYQVHKAIVCPRSDFFAAACRGDMKEARTGIIDLPDDDPQIIDAMVHYFYHLDYNTPSTHAVKDDDTIYPSTSLFGKVAIHQMETHNVNDKDTDIVLHAKVYSLAEKYFINGLKKLALEKFKVAVKGKLVLDDFLEAAQEVYTSTPDSDRVLRNIVLKTLHANSRSWLKEEGVQDLLRQLHTLTYDLLMYFAQ